jgi:hypothetical protein
MQKCEKIVERWTEQIRHEIHEFFNVVREVCTWLPWPLDDLCDLVTDVVEKITVWFEEIVHEIVKVVCKPIDLALEVVSKIIGIILSIPILGPIVRWVRGLVEAIVNQVAGIPEGIAGLLGWLPRKVMDLHVIILRDANGPLVAEADIGQVVAETERIYWSRARVAVTTTIHTLDTIAPDYAFHIDTDGGLFGEDLTMAGSYFQSTMTLELGDSVAGLLLRRPAPIVAFVVKGVGTTQVGCSLGPLADYVCVERERMLAQPGGQVFNTVAHEIGHACGLTHPLDSDKTNLMHSSGTLDRGDNLSPFQRMIVRNSSHVAF